MGVDIGAVARPTSTTAIAPGTIVGGRYRLGGLLGEGAMAEVYEGLDLRLDRAVAVKVLKPAMAARDDICQRFQAEARAAAGLAHPNVVAVYDSGEHDGVPFLVMERLPGDTLAHRIQAGSPDPVDPVWLRQQSIGLLGALAQAHRAGIVHRDVKPGNILVGTGGTLKITDFGIAKSVGSDGTGGVDLTGTGQVLGTPAYLAPERLDGLPATARSDLWAMGVVLYEALAGRKPFDGRTPLEVAGAVAAGHHEPLSELRPDLDPTYAAAVERAMARNPDDRFATAEDMAQALASGPVDPTMSLDVPGGTIAPTVPLRPRAGRARQRPSWLPLALVALLLLGLVIALAADAGSSKDSTPPPSSPTTAAAPATTAPAPSLAQRLRGAAGGLSRKQDGARADDLAKGMVQVADALDAGSPAAAGEATGLMAAATAWALTGQLSEPARATAVSLLSQVPGAEAAGAEIARAAAGTSGGAVTGETSADHGQVTADSPGKTKGKGKGHDD